MDGEWEELVGVRSGCSRAGEEWITVLFHGEEKKTPLASRILNARKDLTCVQSLTSHDLMYIHTNLSHLLTHTQSTAPYCCSYWVLTPPVLLAFSRFKPEPSQAPFIPRVSVTTSPWLSECLFWFMMGKYSLVCSSMSGFQTEKIEILDDGVFEA